MTPRYSKQIRKADCALVVIKNACAWAGHQFSYRRKFKELRDVMDYEPGYGIHEEDITEFIKYNRFPFKCFKIVKNITLKQLENMKDNAVILATQHHGVTHIYLVIKINKLTLTCVNYSSRKKAVSDVSKKEMKQLLKNYSIAYFIKKK